MIRQRLYLFSCMAPALAAWACSDPEDCGAGLKVQMYTLDNPKPRATGAALELAGELPSTIRIKRFTIGGVAVEGTDNYLSWKVTIPANVIEANRTGKTSKLLVSVTDACDKVTALDPVEVEAEAEAGTPAAELSVALGTTECFLPANGSQKTEVLVDAAPSAVGVRVALTASSGQLLGVRESDRTLVLEDNGSPDMPRATTRALLQTVAAMDGVVSVSVNAGKSFDATAAFPVAVAPRFVGTTTVINGKPAFVTVATAGRLKSCSATSTVAGSARFSMKGMAPVDILKEEKPAAIDVAGCGQAALFQADFAAGVPASAVLTLECTDQLDQSASFTLSSQGDPPPAMP